MARALFLTTLAIALLVTGPALGAGVTGSYRSKVGTLDVIQQAKARLQVRLVAFWRDHTGELCTTLPFEKNVARYVKGSCRIDLRFVGPKIEVTQTGSDAECGFGANVTATGTYLRRGSEPPKIDCR